MKEQKKNQSETDNENLAESNKPKVSPKKKRAKKIFILIAALALFWWFSNYTLKSPKYVIYSEKITSPFRIVVLSDQHATEHGISNEAILRKINNAEPDIVFILGDMYSRNSAWELMQIPIELSQMICDSGYLVYFVPGEHDTSQLYIDKIAETGAHVMDYKSEIINVNGNYVEILGIDNVMYSPTFDLNNAFTLTDGCFSILMAHIPNYEKFAQFGTDLTLCGDTHGGIIQLPFDKGPAYYAATGQWLPELFGTRTDIFDKGIFPYTGGNMFITSGIGSYPVPARINNRPEIAVIDIEPEENQ